MPTLETKVNILRRGFLLKGYDLHQNHIFEPPPSISFGEGNFFSERGAIIIFINSGAVKFENQYPQR